MKRLFLLLCLCYPLSIFAQIEQKPQRMGYESGFSSYYTLANQKIHTAEIELHLKKYSPNALNQYKAGKAYSVTALGFSIAALGSSVLYLVQTTKKGTDASPKKKGAALAATGFFLGIGLAFIFSSEKRYEKAKDVYNNEYGF